MVCFYLWVLYDIQTLTLRLPAETRPVIPPAPPYYVAFSIVSHMFVYLFTSRKLILLLRLENSDLSSCFLFIQTPTPSHSSPLVRDFCLHISFTQICLSPVQLNSKALGARRTVLVLPPQLTDTMTLVSIIGFYYATFLYFYMLFL